MLFFTLYCRIFQFCFGLGSRLLPWRQPKRIDGCGSLSTIPTLLVENGARNPLIVTGPRLIKAPFWNALFSELQPHNLSYSVFSDCRPDPTVSSIEAIVRQYRDDGCDCIIAVGGGSNLDAAKAAAARIVRPNRTLAQLGGLLKVRKRLPLFLAVPTTAGTGSETTIAAVVTDDTTHRKYAISDLCLIPHYAILDPQLTVSLPPAVTAATGMDALTHAIEAYLGWAYNTKETRRLAEEAVVAIFQYLERAYRDGSDLEARSALLTASFQAGVAFTRASVGNVHAIAHTLGGLYGIPHGLANAVVLPIVLEDYGAAAEKKLARLAELTDCKQDGTDAEKAQALIAAIHAMNRRMGIPRHLDCLQPDDFPKMAAWAGKEANPLYPVPVIYDEKRLISILEKVQGGMTSP
ncbi:MAG: iron-containing alcohol dehydrogenase [Oscillospiraceae bacterium]|jgi:alcohol dehydrogenase